MQTALVALIVLAAVPHLLLAGGGVVRLAVQFPAVGQRLDSIAFAHWSRAADLGNGLFLYPLLGIGGPLATWAALIVAEIAHAPGSVTLPLVCAAVLAVLHVLTTTQAAPTMLRIGRSEDRAEVITPLIDRFVFWSWPRAILQVLNGAALVWALIAVRAGEPAMSPALLAVVLAALACESILAGAALDQVIVQLPARQKVGTAAYAAYVLATDAANGRVLYPIVGLLSNATTIGAFVLALWLRAPLLESTLLGVAAASGVAAFLVIRRVIPVMSQLEAGVAGSSVGPLVDRLVGGARSRAPLFLLAFACLLATLVAQ
ncbi:MAG TPA: hypothetical protein VGJ87_25345 [Roseiflexaceae bacterium]|jgi:hypothetical protein